MDSYILTLDSQLIYSVIIQLISISILCLILSKILYKPVTEFLQKRRERIENAINEANQKLTDADSLKAEYEIKLKEIEKEKATILEEARIRAKQNEATIIEEAKKEAEAIKNRAMVEIQREQDKAKEEIRLQIIEVSSLVASKFIAKNIDEAEQSKLVEQVIADLGEVKWQN